MESEEHPGKLRRDLVRGIGPLAAESVTGGKMAPIACELQVICQIRDTTDPGWKVRQPSRAPAGLPRWLGHLHRCIDGAVGPGKLCDGDGDGNYGNPVRRRTGSPGIEEIVTASASPWQNAYIERMVDSLRGERSGRSHPQALRAPGRSEPRVTDPRAHSRAPQLER